MSQLPTQIYEVVPLVDGTVLVRVYVPTLVQGGGVTSIDLGRTLVAAYSYPNATNMANALKALISAPPIT